MTGLAIAVLAALVACAMLAYELWAQARSFSDELARQRRELEALQARVRELELARLQHHAQLRSAARLIGAKLAGGYGA